MSNVVKFDETMVVFHGGCSGCTRQQTTGVDGCYDCRYFDAQWDKPDLNNRPPNHVERLRKDIKRRREVKDQT